MALVDAARRPLGGLGDVGRLALGQWRFTGDDVDAAARVVAAAVDLGYDLVDTADVYGLDWGGAGFGACEELLGRVFAANPALRSQVVLATKGGIRPPTPYDASHAYLKSAVEASLRRLQTDVIDLYQIHRPDVLTHPAELAATLSELRDAGKVREVGVSNYTAAQTRTLALHLPFPLVSLQPEYSAVHLDPLFDGTFDLAMETNAAPLVWSPLAGGRLATGDGVRPELLAVLDRLAGDHGTDRATIAVAFTLAHPSRPVAIVGTQQVARLEATRRALDVPLTRADVYAIVQASLGHPLP